MIRLALLLIGEGIFTVAVGYGLNEIGVHPAFLVAWGYFCGATFLCINTSETVSEW